MTSIGEAMILQHAPGWRSRRCPTKAPPCPALVDAVCPRCGHPFVQHNGLPETFCSDSCRDTPMDAPLPTLTTEQITQRFRFRAGEIDFLRRYHHLVRVPGDPDRYFEASAERAARRYRHKKSEEELKHELMEESE